MTEAYRYDGLDRLTAMHAADGSATRYAYDKGDNRIEEFVTVAPGDPLRKASVNAASLGTAASKQTYRYASGTNRLMSLSGGGTSGQRSDNVEAADALPTHFYSWLYHPTGVPLAQFGFVRTGAAAVGAQYLSRRFVYNAARRPVAVYAASDRILARYYYNGEGERVAKTVYPVATEKFADARQTQIKGKTVYSLYHTQRLAAEADSEGRITAHYVYLNGKPVARIDMEDNVGVGHVFWKTISTLGGLIAHVDARDSQGRIYAIHTDHLGTPRVVTDNAQRVVWQGETTPFGKTDVLLAAESGASKKVFEMNLRLPGQVYDAETGLNQNYYRDCDPQSGHLAWLG